MATTKMTSNKLGNFVPERRNKATSLDRARCNSSKTAKIMVVWTKPTGDVRVICNGCYGCLLAQNRP